VKIKIRNSKGTDVFVLDAETGKVTFDPTLISPTSAAHEFVRGLETAIAIGSQFKDGHTVQDFLIEAATTGDPAKGGNFSIQMGAGTKEVKGGDVSITNPAPMKPCTDCKNGIQPLLTSSRTCTSCLGTMKVPA